MTVDSFQVSDVVAPAADIAAVHADEVDREARFPAEAVAALQRAKLLSAGIPAEFGGGGADLATLASATTAIAHKCGSTGLIFAMHHSQVAALVRHAVDEAVRSTLRRIAADELLVASATTEVGSGGDVRKSTCFVERNGTRFRLAKQAPVISYGQDADIILVTARRDADSGPHEQVLVICDRAGLTLEQTAGWDTLGFRGTCSNGFLLTAEGDLDAVLTTPFADISAVTMLPVSHILWAAAWLGLAEEAIDRARQSVQAAARRQPSVTPPGAVRLAEATTLLHQMRALLRSSIARFAELDRLGSMSRTSTVIEFNCLKVSASRLVVEVAAEAMAICGIAGYQSVGPYSIARILRDAYGAGLMVNNDRINGNSAQLLLVGKTI
jgi:acyl-CoA dehydrogenase